MDRVSMPSFGNLIKQVNLIGADDAKNQIHHFNATTLAKIRDEARVAARDVTNDLRNVIRGAYTRGSTGETARTLRYGTAQSSTGVTVQFFLAGRAADYITTLGNDREEIAGGGFPYSIIPKGGKAISFQPKGAGAFTITQPTDRRRKPIIQFNTGRVAAAHVEHPGFPMGDVIRDTATAEIQAFTDRMTAVVAQAVAEIKPTT